MAAMQIAPKTLEKLNASYGPGERHQAMLEISLSLVGDGMPPNEVFTILRQKFSDPEKTDKEIWDLIIGAKNRNPVPRKKHEGGNAYVAPASFIPNATKQQPPKQVALEYLDNRIHEHEPATVDSVEFFKLYHPDDLLNVVTDFTLDKENNKANPRGSGVTKKVSEWIADYENGIIPGGEAGAWFRFNPCSQTGSGTGNSYCDKDISKFMFVLIESDELSIELQLSLYRRFSNLPITSIVDSGGTSYHGLVAVKARTIEEYREIAKALLEVLKPFGFDQSNKNPSRLSRLPGMQRTIGKTRDGFQKLCFVNPQAVPMTLEGVSDFAESLKPMPLKPKSLRDCAHEAMTRYDTLKEKKDGVMIGVSRIDYAGGLRPGTLSIVGAQTNVGKTAFAMNVISKALTDDRAVALFTMEMDDSEITDLLFAINCEVNRTNFNTGHFEPDEIARMQEKLAWIASKKLWIFQEPDPSISDIRKVCLRMKKDHGIDLFVFDYLQLARASGKDSREQEVSAIGRGLRSVAKECKSAVLALSQLNDDGKLRESRALAHEAHLLMMLEEVSSSERTLNITKGRTMARMKIDLVFNGIYGIMKDKPLWKK